MAGPFKPVHIRISTVKSFGHSVNMSNVFLWNSSNPLYVENVSKFNPVFPGIAWHLLTKSYAVLPTGNCFLEVVGGSFFLFLSLHCLFCVGGKWLTLARWL